MKRTDFIYTNGTEPHRIRTKAIIKKYPEIKKLIGRNSTTFWITLACVFTQVGVAWLLRGQAWWVSVIAAYAFGAFLAHILFVVIHECAHNLLFKNKNMNIVAGIIANLPTLVPSSVSFMRYHLKHHTYQGVYDMDADLADHWEARMVGNSALGKALWLLLFPVFQVARTFRLKEIKPVDGWFVGNLLTQVVFTAAIWYFMGPMSILYLILSFAFSIGLHPLGARWIQEHYIKGNESQETYSYYGILNKLEMNIGYHNEHHDFPAIPWNRLPELKAIAPDYYDTLDSHKSWTRLLIQFIFDPEISLYSRITRSKKSTGTMEVSAVATANEEELLTANTGEVGA